MTWKTELTAHDPAQVDMFTKVFGTPTVRITSFFPVIGTKDGTTEQFKVYFLDKASYDAATLERLYVALAEKYKIPVGQVKSDIEKFNNIPIRGDNCVVMTDNPAIAMCDADWIEDDEYSHDDDEEYIEDDF